MTKQDYINEINRIRKEKQVTIVAHFYQKDEVFELSDFSGDSLQLAKMAMEDENPNLVFCGVGFMGESVKILSPNKRVFMPKLACCAMARMIDGEHYDTSIQILENSGIKKEDILSNPQKNILTNKYLGAAKDLFTEDENLPNYISALTFNVPIKKASQVLLVRDLELTLSCFTM